MNRLQRKLGLAYLIVTHNLALLRHISDEMAIMSMGRFVEHGPSERIFAAPARPYTHGLPAAAPHPDPDKRRESVELEGGVPRLARRPRGCEFHTRCRQAQANCRIDAPVPHQMGPGHRALCHYPLVGDQARVA